MKGWYGNKRQHSLASRGIRTKTSEKRIYPLEWTNYGFNFEDGKLKAYLYDDYGGLLDIVDMDSIFEDYVYKYHRHCVGFENGYNKDVPPYKGQYVIFDEYENLEEHIYPHELLIDALKGDKMFKRTNQ